MILSVIQIGNSKGIRLPKSLLEQCHIKDKVEADINGDKITLKPLKKSRAGWGEQMELMHEQGDDALPISDSIDFDLTDWEQ